MKRTVILPLLLAVAMTAAGCEEKEPDFTAESELPYGATMRENSSSYAVPMTYDRRFLEDEEVAAVASLLGAVQNKDADMYTAATPPGYAQYQLDEVYDYESMQELVDALHASVAKQSGEDFQFKMALINDLTASKESGGAADAMKLLDSLSGDTKFSDTVEMAYDLDVEWDLTYDNGGSFATAQSQHIYLFKTKDGCYCMM